MDWNTTYSKGRKYPQFSDVFLDELLALLSKRYHSSNIGRVVDIGCGRGELAIQLAKRGIKVTGFDSSEKALELARANAVEANVDNFVQFIKADIEKFEDNKLEKEIARAQLVICKLVIAFLNDRVSFLKKINLNMRDKALLLLQTPVFLDKKGLTNHLSSISVPKNKIENELKEIFSNFSLLKEELMAEGVFLNTYVVKKN
ncbi:MAG: class I SAM-dependent methyltransferase [bacterium]|nr:class I SAM-dependent methyltransferase [bacterium]